MMKIMMTAAFALAATTAPAIAQTTGTQTGSGSMGSTGSMGSMGSGGMQSGSMQGGMDGSSTTMATPAMSKSQMAAMKRCQASAKAMKTKSCMKMQKMHPDMGSSTSM